MSYSNREKLMNYVQTPPQNDNYVALIILSSTVPRERLHAAGTQAGTSPIDALRTRHPVQSCLSPSHSRPPPRVASGRRGCLRVLLA